MARHFTLEQAEQVLSEVRPRLEEAMELKADYSAVEEEIQGFTQRVAMMGGVQADRHRLLTQRGRRDSLAAQLKESIEAIHSSGCLIKDLDTGLLDFPTLYRGEEVYLCWRAGEPSIQYWHGVHEGFRGRQKIDEDFLKNHQGDLPN